MGTDVGLPRVPEKKRVHCTIVPQPIQRKFFRFRCPTDSRPFALRGGRRPSITSRGPTRTTGFFTALRAWRTSRTRNCHACRREASRERVVAGKGARANTSIQYSNVVKNKAYSNVVKNKACARGRRKYN